MIAALFVSLAFAMLAGGAWLWESGYRAGLRFACKTIDEAKARAAALAKGAR